MFPRSLAFSTAFAVLASSLLHPTASAGAETGTATAISIAASALPEPLPSVTAPSRTAWQARIEGRLASLPQVSSEPSTNGSPGLASALERLAATMDGEADLGIAVKDLRTGETVFEHYGERPLNPASNHKLLTATAAMTLLGADYRFETTVLRDGDTLILRGGGDPSLQVEDVQALAAEVDATGITRIVVDDTMFSEQTFGPGYDPAGPGFSYMAPSGALSVQYNTVVIGVHGDRVQLDPPCDHLAVERGRTQGPMNVTTRKVGTRTVVHVDGRTRGAFRIRRRIADPSRFTASVFARALGHADLPVEIGRTPKSATVLARHRSAPLPEVLGSALKFSNNFTTEQVLRTLGHRATDAPGDWDNGTAVLRAFWAATGQDADDITFENASGLSRRGRVTPHAMVELVSLWAQDERAEAVMDALPVAGREGTLRRRLRRSRGRVRAKTGTLSDATGLTGVVTDAHGDPRYAFSVLVGTERVGAAKRFQDRVVMALVQG